MPSKPFQPIDLSGIKTVPFAGRKSKVSVDDFAAPWQEGGSLGRFLSSLPGILAGRDLKDIVHAMVEAFGGGRTILFGLGAHVIKVGLSPIVIDLMERGIVSAVALNGAGIIHDLELAMAGRTSEDVPAALKNGSFGMTQESCAFINAAIRETASEPMGLGQAMGRAIIDNDLPYRHQSILAVGARLGIPVTVHVAIGTDIIHMHPEFDPHLAGGATHLDFRIFAAVVSGLEKGVYVNVGSAVILPEVFLKSVTLARNLGYPLADFTTVNLDFIQHYRPLANVVKRPTADGGKGYSLTGHHEILLPLIAAGLIEAFEERSTKAT